MIIQKQGLNYRVKKEDITRYWKYVPGGNWTRPSMSSNGTLGAGDVAVYLSYDNNWQYLYQVFNAENTQCSQSWGAPISNTFFIVWTAKLMNIKQIIGKRLSWNEMYLYGSNDNETWESIPITYGGPYNTDYTISLPDNDKYYHYHKFHNPVGHSYVTSTSRVEWALKMEFEASFLVPQESTSSDYVYTTTETKTYAFNING